MLRNRIDEILTLQNIRKYIYIFIFFYLFICLFLNLFFIIYFVIYFIYNNGSSILPLKITPNDTFDTLFSQYLSSTSFKQSVLLFLDTINNNTYFQFYILLFLLLTLLVCYSYVCISLSNGKHSLFISFLKSICLGISIPIIFLYYKQYTSSSDLTDTLANLSLFRLELVRPLEEKLNLLNIALTDFTKNNFSSSVDSVEFVKQFEKKFSFPQEYINNTRTEILLSLQQKNLLDFFHTWSNISNISNITLKPGIFTNIYNITKEHPIATLLCVTALGLLLFGIYKTMSTGPGPEPKPGPGPESGSGPTAVPSPASEPLPTSEPSPTSEPGSDIETEVYYDMEVSNECINYIEEIIQVDIDLLATIIITIIQNTI